MVPCHYDAFVKVQWHFFLMVFKHHANSMVYANGIQIHCGYISLTDTQSERVLVHHCCSLFAFNAI